MTRIFVTRIDDNISQALHLPTMENEIQQSCDILRIPNNMKSKVRVIDVMDNEPLSRILSGNEYNITELNFLMESLDRYTDLEADTFYAVSTALKATDIKDLINLSFSTESYNLVNDLSDLDTLGKDLYLKEQGSANSEEFKTFDGRAYIEQMIANNPSPLISPYGFIYPTKHEPYKFYQGKAFPIYFNGVRTIQGLLKTDTAEELLNLPFEQSELNKTLERLEISNLSRTEFEVMEYNLPENIERIVMQQEDDIHALNEISKQLDKIGKCELKHLSNLVRLTEIREPEDLSLLIGSMHEFEYFPNIHNAEEYGRYMIIDSGKFEHDENLEEFINFRAYGEHRLKIENGAFADNGYLIYHGQNQKLAGILEEIGIEVPTAQSQTMKLYMPLKAITYQEENGYGHMVQVDYEVDIHPYDLHEYEDEILEAIEKNALPEEQKRGMMEYYDENDSVNAKVRRYDFTVERIGHGLMGVAVLELNAPLNEKELATIKETITGQASDGWGEDFEQREIKTDDGRGIYVRFWQSGNWSLQTADELGITEQNQGFEMSMT